MTSFLILFFALNIISLRLQAALSINMTEYSQRLNHSIVTEAEENEENWQSEPPTYQELLESGYPAIGPKNRVMIYKHPDSKGGRCDPDKHLEAGALDSRDCQCLSGFDGVHEFYIYMAVRTSEMEQQWKNGFGNKNAASLLGILDYLSDEVVVAR